MREIVKKLLIVLFRLLPLREDIILESHPDFSDNTYALYEYFLKQGVNRRHRIYWALYDRERPVPALPENVEVFYQDARGFSQMWKRFHALYRARYIIDCNAFIYKRRKGQVRIHLGHGMLIKITRDYHTREKIGECDGYLVTSPFWYDIFTEKVGIKKEVLLPLGYPRNDVLVSEEAKKSRLGRYILWMPTYRQHRLHREAGLDIEYPFGMPEVMNTEQLMELEALLARWDITLYFRPHPVQELSAFSEKRLAHIQIADDAFLQQEKITLYEMLAAAEALITDYSSVYYDFLLTERPIGLTIRDREIYFEHFTCPFSDMKEFIQGSYIESFDELKEFLCQVAAGERLWTDRLSELKHRYHAVTDGSSCQQIYRYLQEKHGLT